MAKCCIYFVFLIWSHSFLSHINAEVFTALVDLEKLLYTEGELVKNLQQYIEHEEQRLQRLRVYVREYQNMHHEASQDNEKFLSNPVNAYLLIKRLSSDWKTVQDSLVSEAGREVLQNLTDDRDDLLFPEEEDLNGAAAALIRLQDTYKLETAALARGEIQGVRYAAPLSASDCFELGRQSYNEGDHYHTVLWMQEAMDRYQEEVNKTVTKSDILEYLAFSLFMQGNVRHALKLTNELLELVPNHSRAKGNLLYYEDAISKQHQQKRGDDGDEVPIENAFTERLDVVEELPERQMYEKICRGEVKLSEAVSKTLSCRYVKKPDPYLMYELLKEETVFHRPWIVIYHDILSDKEMEVIKTMAKPRLKRATVQNYKSGELEFAKYRISKSSWLKGEDAPTINRVNRRIEAITGLTVSTAEDLQVVNYGIGGHYEPHYDFARREETNAFKSLGTGNRIATFLAYMSDVPAGGATVFPHINVALWPKKGAAAFWYNLFKNGEGNMLTRHAACPVLAGSKWVANKWFHERGQELRYPCGIQFGD
ncbi:hypothetical protein CHUAL_002006 [Chamberlinius hualienensis]